MIGSFSLQDLDEWFRMIELCLNSELEASSRVLNSFAKPIPPNDDLVVNSVILDFTENELPLSLCINGSHVEVDNNFLYFECKDSFLLVPGVEESRIAINISADEPHVRLMPVSEIKFQESECPDAFENILADSVSKILFENGITYSNNRFYEIRLPTQAGFSIVNSDLSGVITPINALLDPVLNEKGTVNGSIETVDDEFSQFSVFHLIDKLKNYCLPNPTLSDLGPFYSYITKPDLMLCSDMGTEPADFIISSPEKLVYVHVKCGTSKKRPESSAGALAEVGSQAIKNLEMLMSRNQNLKAANWTNLLSDWPEPDAAQRLSNRIRLLDGERFDGTSSPTEPALERLWEIVTERRRSVNVQKEVWIIAANSFSAAHFEQQMRLGNGGRSESLQAYQLLQGWVSACANLDVEIRVFTA